ncbi:hypothetical protein [Amycolatopsis lexingtonensis]|uniref:hypothetical protein n=1 Tax=Amycolatopsis lexingtonensis TaxID=218822 RepID=UPI003F6E928E
MIRAAAPGGLVPTRPNAAALRLRWFAYTYPARSGDPVIRPAGPGEDGAFPAVIWRTADQAAARDAAGAVLGVAA